MGEKSIRIEYKRNSKNKKTVHILKMQGVPYGPILVVYGKLSALFHLTSHILKKDCCFAGLLFKDATLYCAFGV